LKWLSKILSETLEIKENRGMNHSWLGLLIKLLGEKHKKCILNPTCEEQENTIATIIWNLVSQ
jgi:hypothetical protein